MKAQRWMGACMVAMALFATPCQAQPPFPPPPMVQTVENANTPGASSPTGFLPRLQHHWRRARLGAPIFEEKTPTQPTDPTKPNVPPDPSTPTPPTSPTNNPADALAGAGQYKSSTGHASPVLAGTGLGAAVSGDPFSTAVLTPLVLPGLFTVAATQAARPMDRVFFEYGRSQGAMVSGVGANAPFLIRTPLPQPPPPPPQDPPIISSLSTGPSVIIVDSFDTKVGQRSGMVRGFNLNTFNIGIEKTFFDGLTSGYLSIPFLNATENISGQPINGLGDVSVGFKVILYQNLDNGNTFTGGFTVSFPSGKPAFSRSFAQTREGTGNELVQTTTTLVNPTFLQPYLAGLLVWDRFFVHNYFSAVVPTDIQVATFLNNDLSAGYTMYRAPGRFLSSITPNASAHLMVPLNNVGVPPGPGTAVFVPSQDGLLPPAAAPGNFGFPHQLSLSGGMQIGMGQRCLFGLSAATPVVGPRAYDWSFSASLNYFY